MADITSIKIKVGEKELELTGDEWREVYLRLDEIYGMNSISVPTIFKDGPIPPVTTTWIGDPIIVRPSTGTTCNPGPITCAPDTGQRHN